MASENLDEIAKHAFLSPLRPTTKLTRAMRTIHGVKPVDLEAMNHAQPFLHDLSPMLIGGEETRKNKGGAVGGVTAVVNETCDHCVLSPPRGFLLNPLNNPPCVRNRVGDCCNISRRISRDSC